MSTWLFRVAAALSLLGLIAHELLGAPMVLPPLSKTDMPDAVIWFHHFSWHAGSVAVAAVVVMYIYASIRSAPLSIAIIATGMSLGFACLGIGLGLWGSKVMWATPTPYIWSIITVLGVFGVLSSRQRGGS